MKVKMDQMVRWDDGTVATPRQMVDRGLAEVRVVERFQGSARMVAMFNCNYDPRFAAREWLRKQLS